MVVNTDSFTELFTRLGVSEYEGKVYVALVSANPATAYEAAKEAGIPTSKGGCHDGSEASNHKKASPRRANVSKVQTKTQWVSERNAIAVRAMSNVTATF